MRTGKEVRRDILADMKVKLLEEFHQNFTRKAFFDKPWKPRKKGRRGSLLLVSGKLRRSLKAKITSEGGAFHSSMPYASAHNEGFKGNVSVRHYDRKEHKARRRVRGRVRRVSVRAHSVSAHTHKMNLPERRFVGDHPKVQRMVADIVSKQLETWGGELAARIKRRNRSITDI